jgi:hypothetical protein
VTDTAPLVRKLTTTIPAQTAAVDADQVIGEAPFACTLTSASIIPEAAVTGATSTARTFTIVNKGAAGAGTTVMATLALITGVDLVAFDEKDFTLSVVSGATTAAQGDIIAVVETHASTGTAHSGGTVQVELTRA